MHEVTQHLYQLAAGWLLSLLCLVFAGLLWYYPSTQSSYWSMLLVSFGILPMLYVSFEVYLTWQIFRASRVLQKDLDVSREGTQLDPLWDVKDYYFKEWYADTFFSGCNNSWRRAGYVHGLMNEALNLNETFGRPSNFDSL
ncbi:MAG TPA: hypothetical protein VM103_02930 [Candidatus Paceibacterota bacterium]|nr:hypothetical protein [Candidatus Paceibacterota bacterium]